MTETPFLYTKLYIACQFQYTMKYADGPLIKGLIM